MSPGHKDSRRFCRDCNSQIIFARSPVTNRRFPLDARLVPPGTPGSRLVVYGKAYPLKRRDEALADYHRVMHYTSVSDLPHHMPHVVTCAALPERSHR